MGCAVEYTDTGVQVDVHRFDNRLNAVAYVERSRGYAINNAATAAGPGRGFEFYNGPVEGERAVIRPEGKLWRAAFWIEGDIRVSTARPVDGKPAWHGEYRNKREWRPVENGAGYAIAYASPEAAHAGAKFALDQISRNNYPLENR